MLENITPQQLKSMNFLQLNALCGELREKIIETVMVNGGHLSSNLGMVELTVALHYVFDFPTDKLIFDVGHQCYSHKLLTGRYDCFNTLRRMGGLSGFPKREESEYDCYNTGHAGTSVSAAMGIAKARDIKGEDFNVIAVIGDGSFNNGLVYEAFNSLRPLKSKVLVILNDNRMSISPTVGSMHEYLEKLSDDGQRSEKKRSHETIFERYGFAYDGVYDGNDLSCMIQKLTEIKRKLATQSVILHIITKKGKGYLYCEENPQETHGISSLGDCVSTDYSEILGKKLTEIAQTDKNIVAVTAAMTPSLGLSEFFDKYPERSVDVGICEAHAAVMCAAMATLGLKPYYAVYSTFLQRAFDEVMIDVCSQNLPVTICIDRAGVSGSDGETHQGIYDLSFLSLIPNLTIAVPKDLNEFEQIIEWSASFNAPLAIRYPKDGKRIFTTSGELECGKWEILTEGDDAVIIACGERMIGKSIEASHRLLKDGIHSSVVNARFVKPIDRRLLADLKQRLIITVEDNTIIGGIGYAVNGFYSESDKRVKNFAFPDKFIPHGGVDELAKAYGITVDAIVDYVRKNANR